jgi:hypothetical protein
MAKKKPTPILTRNVGKDKVIRFFVKGTNKQVSNKNNKAAKAFVNQDFQRLVSSPTAQATLTPFEKQVLRNKENALKGRDIISDKAKKATPKRYRIKGRFVGKDVQNTIDFNPKLKVLFKDKNLNNTEGFENVVTDEQALELLGNEIDSQLTNQIQVLIDNEPWTNISRFRPEGTFTNPIEVLDMINEIERTINDKTNPPTELKVILPNGEEFEGKRAYSELNKFIVEIVDELRTEKGVAALFFLPWKYISPFLIVDLRDFDPRTSFVEQSSTLPRINPDTNKRSA